MSLPCGPPHRQLRLHCHCPVAHHADAMVLDTAADQLLDADADGSGPRLSHPARRATPAHPATLSPAAAAAARRKPPVPPATRLVTAAAARALQGSARHFAVDAGAAAATTAAGASSPPLQPTAGLAAPSQVCPSITVDGCGADGSSAEATAAGIESAETGAGMCLAQHVVPARSPPAAETSDKYDDNFRPAPDQGHECSLWCHVN